MVELKVSLVDGSLLEIINHGNLSDDEHSFNEFIEILAHEGVKYLERQSGLKDEN